MLPTRKRGVKMAENKTVPTDTDVAAWLAALEPAARRADAQALTRLLAEATGAPPVLWGASIIGFGQYRYIHDTGRSAEWMRLGYAPRASSHVLYLMDGLSTHADAIARLGKVKPKGGCLHVPALAKVDLGVLADLARASWAAMAAQYPL